MAVQIARGDIIRVREWPDTSGQRFCVKDIDEDSRVVHAYAIDGRWPDGRPRKAALRSFPLHLVEVVP